MKRLFLFVITTATFSNFIGCSKSDPPTTQTAPTITSFAPATDTVGGQVIITGTNFSTTASNDKVNINGVAATVTNASTTQLTITVPANATSGNITVSVSGLTASSTSGIVVTLPNQLLILGTWKYINSIATDTIVFPVLPVWQRIYLFPNPDPIHNYMTFTDKGIAYYFQQGWGEGHAGIFYQDSVKYTIQNNNIFLFYPAGVNYSSTYTYNAYEDTIVIKKITANVLSTYRTYHYKHWAHYPAYEIELKQSVDSLGR